MDIGSYRAYQRDCEESEERNENCTGRYGLQVTQSGFGGSPPVSQPVVVPSTEKELSRSRAVGYSGHAVASSRKLRTC